MKLRWIVTLSLVLLSWLDICSDVFAITQYASLAKQRRTKEWRCSNGQVTSGWNNSAATRQEDNPFLAPVCASRARGTGSEAADQFVLDGPPYEFAFWMCLYLTAGLCVGHLLTQAVFAMWAMWETRRAEYADECSSCWPVLPFITAFARGLVLWEPAYQFLCMYSPPKHMGPGESDQYTRHAERAFVRLRLAETLFKGPCKTVALFALLLQAVARSSSSSAYLPAAAFGTRGFDAVPMVASALSFAIGTLSTLLFSTAYALSQRQSLWGCAKPPPSGGLIASFGSAAGVSLYSLCSFWTRALAFATAVAALMLDDNIATRAFYLMVGAIGFLILLGWELFTGSICCSVHSCVSNVAPLCKGCYCAFVSTCVVNIPWNTARTACSSSAAQAAVESAARGGAAAGGAKTERRWWPSAAFTGVMCSALIGAGLVLSIVAGGKATCYAACNGHANASGGSSGYQFFSVTCGLIAAALALCELVLYAVLSCTAPRRAVDDGWNDYPSDWDPNARISPALA